MLVSFYLMSDLLNGLFVEELGQPVCTRRPTDGGRIGRLKVGSGSAIFVTTWLALLLGLIPSSLYSNIMILPRLAATSIRGASPLTRAATAAASSSSRTFATSAARLANSLLFLEHKNGTINPASLVALTAASKVGGDVDGIVLGGDDVDGVVDKAAKCVLPSFSHSVCCLDC